MDLIRRSLLDVLIVVLGGLYVYVAIYDAGIERFIGVLGGIGIVGAVFVKRRSRQTAGGLLLLGALPLAILTWWSIVTPLIAGLAILLAALSLSRKRGSCKVTAIRFATPAEGREQLPT